MTIYEPSFIGALSRRRDAPAQYYSPDEEPYRSMWQNEDECQEYAIIELVKDDAFRAAAVLRNTVHARDELIEIARPMLLEDRRTWLVMIDVTDHWHAAIKALNAGLCYNSATQSADYDATVKFLERHLRFDNIQADSQVWDLLGKYDPADPRLAPTLSKFTHWKLGAELVNGRWRNPDWGR